MEKRNNNQESGNGFLLGVVLGSIATLLFSTKKGREILKEVTEKGLEKVSELEERLKKAKELEVIIEEENDYINSDLRPTKSPVQVDEAEKNKFVEKQAPAKPSDPVRLDEVEKVKLAKIEEKLKKTPDVKSENTPTPKPQRTVKRFFKFKKK